MTGKAKARDSLYLSLMAMESSAARMCRICESLQWRSTVSMPSSVQSNKYQFDVNTLLSIRTKSPVPKKTFSCNFSYDYFQYSHFTFVLHNLLVGGGGGGGFFLACKDLGRMFDHSFPACIFFFFFKVEISLCKLISLFMP